MQEFRVGDHVIVTGNEGRSGHRLTHGDALVVDPIDSDREYYVEGLDVDGVVDEWFVNECDLVAADEPTHPERIYKTGDRVLVTGNTSKCAHYLTVGTDAEVISDKGYDNWRPELYRVRGLGLYGAREQWVHPDDLEAEPAHSRRSWWVDYAPADYKAERTIDYTLTPAATIALDDNLVRRYLALHGATELLGASRDVDELTAVADWLLAS